LGFAHSGSVKEDSDRHGQCLSSRTRGGRTTPCRPLAPPGDTRRYPLAERRPVRHALFPIPPG
jgi:hypothetical protein